MTTEARECRSCLYAKGKWQCWRRVIVCKKYQAPAVPGGCIDHVEKNRGKKRK